MKYTLKPFRWEKLGGNIEMANGYHVRLDADSYGNHAWGKKEYGLTIACGLCGSVEKAKEEAQKHFTEHAMEYLEEAP